MKPFSLLVKPAAADCNLSCRYCFYLDRRGLYPDERRHRMTDEVAAHMIATYLATPQPLHSFVWQGGEPTLMGLEFFRKVAYWQRVYGRPGSVVSNALQTNATLIGDAWAEHLARNNFLVGVSIDGPPDAHDTYRASVSGRGSLNDVVNGLKRLQKHGVECNVLTLVSQANVRRPRQVYHFLKDDLGIPFHQYIECVEFDDSGALMPFAISGAEWGDFLCAIYNEWLACDDTRRVSVRLFDSILTLLVDHYPNACVLARDCRQYLVVEHNGDVYPCDFFVRTDLKLGNIMEKSWAALLASERYAEFGARKRQWSEKCSDCKYLEFCAGCCPKNRPDQGSDKRLSVLCDGWMQFYDHAMPGLRRLASEIRAQRRAEQASMFTQFAAEPSQSVNKVARNDPCPCGSGTKYKKCCGRGSGVG